MIVALVGNQNSGKTTLFNTLTGANQKVGNWPGVTIERKEGHVKGTDITIVDLPGIYSLSPYSSEEKISRNFALDANPDLIINIVDATSLERSLYLTTQLLETGRDVIIALNMYDLVKKRNIHIDKDKLEKMLNTTVVDISAKTGEGVDHLLEHIKTHDIKPNKHLNIYPKDVSEALRSVENDLKLADVDNTYFYAVKTFEGENDYRKHIKPESEKKIEEVVKKYDMDGEELIASLRYDFIDKVKKECFTDEEMKIRENQANKKATSWTDKLDKIFLNKWAAIPIFIVIMALVYILSVGLVGGLTVSFVDALFNGAETIELNFFGAVWEVPFEIAGIGPGLGGWLESIGASPWAVSLVADGIVAGVGAVCNFVPQLIILFLCLALLETTGYMSRISFFLDRIFHKFGLSGKSLVPFIVGVGCSVPGIMACRTVEDENERKASVILTPLMPCSAKLPIISAFAGFFFASYAWIVSLSFYFIAIILILVFGIIFKKYIFKGSHTTFISELPEYKTPNASYVARDVWDRTASFIKRAGTIILLCSVVVWFLGSFTWQFQYVDGELITINDSLLANVGMCFAWVFAPMLGGNLSWGAAVSAVTGLVAKEEVIGSMTTIAALAGGEADLFGPLDTVFNFFNPITAFAFMTFNLFSAPCFGALGAMKNELGSNKSMLKSMAFLTGFAWLVASLIGSISWIITAAGGTI